MKCDGVEPCEKLGYSIVGDGWALGKGGFHTFRLDYHGPSKKAEEWKEEQMNGI